MIVGAAPRERRAAYFFAADDPVADGRLEDDHVTP